MFVYGQGLVLVHLVTLLPIVFSEQPVCRPDTSCQRTPNTKERFFYDIHGKQVEIEFTDMKSFSMSCVKAEDLPADDPSLPAFGRVVTVEKASFIYCALPNGSYAAAVDALNIKVTKSLEIQVKSSSPLVHTHSAGLKVDNLAIHGETEDPEPLQLIEDNFLSELHQLKSLVMYNLNISTPQVFLALPASLRNLNLNQVAFPTVSDDTPWLGRLKSLESLAIYDSNEEKKMWVTLPKLVDFPNLTTINIKSVPINFSEGCLDGSALRSLTLTSCGLSHLNSSTFIGVNLTSLNLSGNGLDTLPDGVFSPLQSLTSLDLSNNALRADSVTRTLPVLKMLQKLTVTNNPLGSLCGNSIFRTIGESSELPSSLRILELQQTGADRVCADWLNFRALKYINLEGNNISSLRYEDLVMVRTQGEPVVLNLIGNELKKVHLKEDHVEECRAATATTTPTSLTRPRVVNKRAPVILRLNTAIPCNCEHAWFREALRSCKSLLTVSRPLECIVDRSAATPPETYRTLQEYEPDQLLCPHKDTCSVPGCSCWNRKRGNAMVMWCNRPLPEKPHWPASIKNWPLVLHAPGTGLTEIPDGMLEELHVSNNNITSFSEKDIQNSLRILDLTNNSISHISEATALRLLRVPPTQLRVNLSGNPLVCDCNNSAALMHLKTATNQIMDLTQLECMDNRRILELTAGDLCPNVLWPVLAVVMSVILFVVIITIVFMRHLKLYVKQYCLKRGMFLKLILNMRKIPDDPSKDIDIFVSYANPDLELADNLMKALQARGYRTMNHQNDFHPGLSIIDNIAEFIKRSRIFLLVVTDNFGKSNWCMHEYDTAHSVSIQGDTARVLVVLYPLTDPKNIPDAMQCYLKSNTYLMPDDVNFYGKIETILGKRHLNTAPASKLPIQIEIEETPGPMPVQSEQEMELVPLAGNEPETVHPTTFSSPTKEVEVSVPATPPNVPPDRLPTPSLAHLSLPHKTHQLVDLIELAPRIETVAS